MSRATHAALPSGISNSLASVCVCVHNVGVDFRLCPSLFDSSSLALPLAVCAVRDIEI